MSSSCSHRRRINFYFKKNPLSFKLIPAAATRTGTCRLKMAWDPICWLIFFVMNVALIGLNIYQIICLSDLQDDYLNPFESSSRINAVVVPEMVLQGALCILFLLTGHWLMFIVTLPNTFYNAMLFMKGQHLIDVTEVFRFLKAEKKYRLIKLGFYLILFVIVLIRLVFSLVYHVFDEDDGIHEYGMFH